MSYLSSKLPLVGLEAKICQGLYPTFDIVAPTLNPLSSDGDSHQTSPCYITTKSIVEVMRIEDVITTCIHYLTEKLRRERYGDKKGDLVGNFVLVAWLYGLAGICPSTLTLLVFLNIRCFIRFIVVTLALL